MTQMPQAIGDALAKRPKRVGLAIESAEPCQIMLLEVREPFDIPAVPQKDTVAVNKRDEIVRSPRQSALERIKVRVRTALRGRVVQHYGFLKLAQHRRLDAAWCVVNDDDFGVALRELENRV